MDFSKVKEWVIPEGKVSKVTINDVVVWLAKQLKDFASTLFPFTLTNSTGDNLVDYKIYGNTEQGGVPDDYVALQYLQSTGTQYINTGIIPNANHITEATGIYAQPGFAFGCRVGNPISYSGLTFEAAGTISVRWGNTMLIGTDPNPEAGVEWKVHIENGNSYTTTTTTTTTSYGSDFGPNTIFLFDLNNNGTQMGNTSYNVHKISSYKMWESGKLIIDLIPVKRKKDAVLGMYDRVTGKLFTNNGTGVFTAGPAVMSPENSVEIKAVGDFIPNEGVLFSINTSKLSYKTGFIPMTGAYPTNNSSYPNAIYWESPVLQVGQIISITNISSANTNSRMRCCAPTGNTCLGQLSPTVSLESDYYTFVTGGQDGYLINATIKVLKPFKFVLMWLSSNYKEYTINFSGSYSIPVYIHGKNLFDKSISVTEKQYLNRDNTTSTNNYWNFTDYIPVHGNKFTLTRSVATGLGPCILGYDKNKNVIAYTTYNNTKVVLLESSQKIHYIRFSFMTTENLDEIQLENGEESTTYEAYKGYKKTTIVLDRPLYKVGDHEDYIDFENKWVCRQNGEVELSSLNWNTSEVTTLKRLATTISNIVSTPASTRNLTLMAEKYPCLKDSSANSMFSYNKSIYVYNTETPSGKLIYQLETPTTESISLPEIETLEGDFIIDVDTELDPSDITLQLYIKSK